MNAPPNASLGEMAADRDGEIQIPVDAEEDRNSYADDDDELSDTTSLASTIYQHRYENGRRYRAYEEGSYWGPNDDIQNDQLDISHHMFTLLLDGNLFLAPIQHPKHILDIGTGTGIWAIDVADENPTAEVLGIDLSPTQPTYVPPNLSFQIDDCTANWTYPPNTFDLIHIRALYGSVGDWPQLYKQAFDHLSPGGWIDQVEMDIQFKSDDGTCPPDHILSQWSSTFIGIGEQLGKTFKIGERAKELMINAGFVNVTQHKYKVPLGGWSGDKKMKEIGRWNLLQCYQGAEGWGLFLLTKIMKWSVDEAMAFITKFKTAMKNKNTHSYFDVYAVYGQKPSEATGNTKK